MPIAADEFTRIFREEHRTVRDALLDLVQAFRNRDKARIGSLLGIAAAFVGPHFRYEEESLYPALSVIFGEEYINDLLVAHDKAIAGAKRLVQLAGKELLTNADVEEAVRIIRRTLPHVSDCDGLSVMVEKLPEPKVQTIFEARDRARKANLDLLTWADGVRGRALVVPG